MANMFWGKTPPPLCDFVQWLDTEQSQEDKDHVEREVGGLQKGGGECSTRNRWRKSARKTRKISGRGLQKWNVRRRRNVKLTGRRSERVSAVQRKQGLKLLGRENIRGVLSKARPCNPGNLNSLKHVRFR